jgi:hypothetical protein
MTESNQIITRRDRRFSVTAHSSLATLVRVTTTWSDRRPGILACIAVTCAASVLAACGSNDEARQSVSRQTGCGVDALLIPRCGALWGISTPENRDLSATEQVVGRKFDMVYRFHDINATIPTQFERRLANSGTILHYSIDPRDYGNASSTAISWADIAAGDFDWSLRRQAEGIASLHRTVFVTFDHEADQREKTARGSAPDFKAAWRHVHQVFEEAHARIVWVWVVIGYPETFARAGMLWPGNRYVDWISWDVYNTSGCRDGQIDPSKYRSFEDAMLPFYEWINSEGPRYGIDKHKPMMISEAASAIYPGNPAMTARWYEQIPQTLRKYPRIKAVTLWSSVATCDYRVTNNPTVTTGVAEAGRSPIFDQLSGRVLSR